MKSEGNVFSEAVFAMSYSELTVILNPGFFVTAVVSWWKDLARQ